ncbi:ADP-ribosyltransferase [Cellulomonas sp. Y8]|uniref:ADP-ribosyltransferase n=1 Tax=Cellulomonas sp. Y8 TaxID=2591145 RepID=UPI003D736CE1
MTANPLVAGPVDTSTAFGGAGLLDSVTQLSASLQSGDWLAAGLSGVGVALDTAAAVMDPFGSLIAAGLGWLMEHLEPLKGWLNDLTGDAGAVLGFAATWENVATAMNGAGDELNRIVAADLEAMSGASVVAYATYANNLADRVRAGGGSASAMASALRTCSTVVQVVHDLVRDTLAQLVGSIISWAAELVLTVGLATPYVVSQVTTRVSSLAVRVGRSVTGLLTSAKSLKGLLEAMKDVLARLASGVRGRLPGGSGAPSAPRVPDGPSVPARSPLPDISDLDALHPKNPGGDLDAWSDAVAARHPTLEPDEVRNIYRYTTDQGYQEMNGYLRNPSAYSDADAVRIRSEVDSAVSGMSKLPTHGDTTFRGTYFPEPVLEQWQQVGNHVSDRAFWSTSTEAGVAEDFRIRNGGNAFVTVEGRSGVDVQPLSHYGREAEVLMPPGTVFEVREAQLIGEGAGSYWAFVGREVAR